MRGSGLVFAAIWIANALVMLSAPFVIPFVPDQRKRRILIVLYIRVFPVLGIIPCTLLLEYFDVSPPLAGAHWSVKLLFLAAWVAVPWMLARALERAWRIAY